MKLIRTLALCASAMLTGHALAQGKTNLSISTGGTGGVYYPLGGGMASILTKHVPTWAVTAEVTGASVDNMKLINAGKTDVGFSMVDTAWEAYMGVDKFKDTKVPARTLMVLYPNRTQVVTVEGTGIKKVRNRLFHFGRDVSSNNAVAAIKKEGFEPATHVHCLAFGATFPEGQRKYPIIGLGSGASFHGRRFVPCLSSRNDDERSLDLTWCGGAWTWNGDCRFLGVQEVSDA